MNWQDKEEMTMAENTQPLVSVIMPVYNAARFLKQAMESVLRQSYRNLELIMIDDGSTDDSLSMMRAYAAQDDRVRVIANEKNRGVSYVRNCGIRAARGEYIALLDSDDVWLENKLESQVRLQQETGADIVYCSLDFINEEDRVIKRPFIVPPTTDYSKMLVRCVFTCSTVMMKARLLKENPFPADYYHEDFLLWMKLMELDPVVAGDPAVMAHNRQVAASRSGNKAFAAVKRWEIYRKGLHMGVVSSAVSFIQYAFWGILKYY